MLKDKRKEAERQEKSGEVERQLVKLLWPVLAGLAYAFLLSLLVPTLASLCSWLLRTFCHRTGKRSRETPTPLYRLRIALSFLWLTHPPPFFSLL